MGGGEAAKDSTDAGGLAGGLVGQILCLAVAPAFGTPQALLVLCRALLCLACGLLQVNVKRFERSAAP